MPNDKNYVVELRDDQWELIVLAMRHIRGMAHSNPESQYSVDRLGRLFLVRRVTEIERDITAIVGEIEK
jgi:hypothetical protein